MSFCLVLVIELSSSSFSLLYVSIFYIFFFFFNDTATTEIYTLSLHDALPISLGQFSGRVQQTYKHSVPRFFVPEHGTMFTLALVRFPPTATKEIQYLNAKGALTYTDIAGDPVLYGNLSPREISMKDVFRSGDSSKKFKIAEGQWYRYAPSYVSPAYHLLEGFPFIQEPPSGDLQERVLIRHHDYDQCFQSVQLLQWNSQVKFNVTVYRNLPTTRDSIMTS